MNPMLLRKFLTLSIVMLALASVAQAECYIGGEITAEMNTDPTYPAWQYTATINWDTGTPYALSHLDLLLDTATGTCMCSDISDNILFEGIYGTSEGEGGCEVSYETTLECSGDPSVPDVEGILFKFEPIEDEYGCEPGTTGTGTFVFYSDIGPAPIDEEILVLFDKFGQLNCSGNLSGFFPGLSCDPVDTEPATWDALKSLYR